ncbi:hypothetical protein FYJ26_00455 [Anaerococcus sp. WCA-380-WT-2B]|uniref:Uncharacterized protein n=1 Tax=Anaerococcus porci TaxID=2652269 RepID=A0A6N7VT91_9FIRM|nr:hypothetical protein [Anaerococcus porci]MSS76919.1 hypothetical protein [Anaerococcus porci]
MKKQNKLILSTFIVFSSVIALNSTSLADDDIEYKNQISSVNEEYEESLVENPLKEDNKINYNLANDDKTEEINKKDSIDNSKKYNEELEKTNTNYANCNIVEKIPGDKLKEKDLDNLTNDKYNLENKNHEELKNNNDKENLTSDHIEVKSYNNKTVEDLNLKGKESQNTDKSSKFTFYSANSNSRFFHYSNSDNSYIIEKDLAYRYDNRGRKITVSNSWFNIGKDKYFANSKGEIVKGIQRIGFDRFYFANNGVVKTNTKVITNIGAYIIGESGIMNPLENKWLEVNSNKYHTGYDGKLDKGFNLIENNLYSFDDNGKLEKNKLFLYNKSIIAIDNNGIVDKKRDTKIVIDNLEYTSDKNGNVVSIKDLSKKPEVVTYYMQGNKAYKKYNNNKTELAKNE